MKYTQHTKNEQEAVRLDRGPIAQKWFGITPASVEAAKAARESGAEGKIVALANVAG